MNMKSTMAVSRGETKQHTSGTHNIHLELAAQLFLLELNPKKLKKINGIIGRSSLVVSLILRNHGIPIDYMHFVLEGVTKKLYVDEIYQVCCSWLNW